LSQRGNSTERGEAAGAVKKMDGKEAWEDIVYK